MRAFRYADAGAADAAAATSAASACGYGAVPFAMPDRPEVGGSVVTGVIPTTAFAGWRMGDRRFVVAVESATDEPDHVEEARQLALEIAAGELEAAGHPPPTVAP